MSRSVSFAFWQMAFNKGWADEEQVRFATTMGDLTETEFQLITGKDY